MKNRVLITGIAGFVGSNLAKRLLDEGHDVYGVDDLSAGNIRFVPTDFFRQDGGDHGSYRGMETTDFASDTILRQIKKQKYDIVMHLAAQPRVLYTVEHPYDSNETNVSKSLKLLEACKGNVKRFINTSSAAVYGSGKLPMQEDQATDPVSPYALQKLTMEKYCEMFSHLYKMDTVSIRPFNIFGPNQIGTSPYSTAVSAWLWAVKEGRPLRSDGDGTQSRDLIYVDNVVDMYMELMSSRYFFNGETFNAGTGTAISNNEILDWFRKEYPSCQVVNAPSRLGDVVKTQADILYPQMILKYNPKVKFWDGLERTRQWVMNYKV